jgi:L-2-hydroxyglutarate oxidase LhgO
VPSVDVVVIGAGVVGLACAEALARAGRSVLVVERHEGFGRETSSRNSQVIHAGMYYPTGSLKAELCVRGNRSLRAWCEQRQVPFRMTGKYIVAVDPAEEPALEAILQRGHANGVEGLVRASAAELAAAEPHVTATMALWSPDSGIVDSHALMASLHAEAQRHGCDFAWRHALVAAEPGWTLELADAAGHRSTLTAGAVVNAAGLRADEVAALAGFDVDALGYRQRFVKGHYFRIRAGRTGLVRHLIYPLPPADLAGLGIHLTLELDGALRLGPDVEPIDRAAERYDVPESLAQSFHTAASRYLRWLTPDELTPDQSGIRPKLARPGEVADFLIREESAHGRPRWVNLIGIESPGLTASLEIAQRVSALV